MEYVIKELIYCINDRLMAFSINSYLFIMLRQTIIITLIFCLPLFSYAGSNKFEDFSQSRDIIVSGPASRYLKKIRFHSTDGYLGDDTTIKLEQDGTIGIYLGLGESTGRELILYPKDPDNKFRVEQQFTTSLTIMNEGPHIDLVDWKHHVSDWFDIETKENYTFITKEFSSSKFPDVTPGQIVEAVRMQLASWKKSGYNGGEHWIKLASQCITPTTYPCGVAINRLRFRISINENGNWKIIQYIDVEIPMGC